ncbi:MAG: response regulator transcription factor [Campylobacterota bacterium]|nr:response regulator transcription factor [Campylobacterota bacterium]
MSKILLLEDNPSLAKTLVKYLTIHGYEVTWTKNGEEALDESYHTKYHLYLFDINVPLLNGVDLLQLLRDAEDYTPTIIISALIDVASVTEGFRAGADDYLKKPFDPEELLVRIQAKTAKLQKIIKCKGYELDTKTKELRYDDEPIELSEVQKNIFIALITHYPNPVTKDEILLLLEKPTDIALRVNISKLKKNLNIELENVRGVGYKII